MTKKTRIDREKKLGTLAQMFTEFRSVWKDVAGWGPAIVRRFAICTVAVVAVFIILMGCYLANIAGHREVGIVVWLLLTLVLVLAWLFPVLAGRKTTERYFILLANIQIWLTAAFAAIVFPDWQKNQEYFFLLPMSVSIVSLGFVWGYEKTWVYCGAIAVTTIMVVTLVSNTISVPIFGADLLAKTAADQQVEKAKEIIKEGNQKLAVVAMIRRFEGKTLTANEAYLIAKYGDPSLIGRVKALFVKEPAPAKQASAEKAETPEVDTASTPDPVAAAPAVAMPATYNLSPMKPSAQSIPSEAVVYWGENYRWKYKIKIVRLDDKIIIEKSELGGGTFIGERDNNGNYSGNWTEPAAYGTFDELSVVSGGNVIAMGKILTESGKHPLQIRKN